MCVCERALPEWVILQSTPTITTAFFPPRASWKSFCLSSIHEHRRVSQMPPRASNAHVHFLSNAPITSKMQPIKCLLTGALIDCSSCRMEPFQIELIIFGNCTSIVGHPAQPHQLANSSAVACFMSDGWVILHMSSFDVQRTTRGNLCHFFQARLF